MKKLTSIILLACLTLAASAQDGAIKVNSTGAKPTITDFAKAYLGTLTNDEDVEECEREGMGIYTNMETAISRQSKGLPLKENETLTIDTRNGYLLYEWRYGNDMSRVEMCFWNEADGKHKLFACSRETFSDRRYVCGQFDDHSFYRYNNATKKMTYVDAEEIGFYEATKDIDGGFMSIELPRVGKNISVTVWFQDGKKLNRTLKWNGGKFTHEQRP